MSRINHHETRVVSAFPNPELQRDARARAEDHPGAFEIELSGDALLAAISEPSVHDAPKPTEQPGTPRDHLGAITTQARAARSHAGRRSTVVTKPAAVTVGVLIAGIVAYGVVSVDKPVSKEATPMADVIDTPLPSVENAHSSGPPVRFANPFDRTEVFEFPARTSEDDARQRVANLLVERAIERRAVDRRIATPSRAHIASR